MPSSRPHSAPIDEQPPEPWRLRLLGALALTDPAGAPVHVAWRAAAQLLARLALGPARMHPREELIELLWPGVSLAVGRNRLRQAMASLKSLLAASSPAPLILADRVSVWLAPAALQCDAVEFERHLRAGQWELAEALYQGELLPGHYEDWVLDERSRLARLAERVQAMPHLPATPRAASAQAAGQLPAFWTRLFGVDEQVRSLCEVVRQRRLVSLIGAGGSGKTRLAAEVARVLRDGGAADGPLPPGEPAFQEVRFVSLVDRSSAAQALDAMAAAVQAQGSDPLAGIQAALAGRRALLVLDNFEQLVGQAEAQVVQLLEQLPQLHVLVTTRVRLKVPDGQELELGGLPTEPSAAHGEGAAAGGGVGAAQALFIDRARLVAPQFEAGEVSAQQAISALVRLLSGLPLAIELAASRMRSLTPRELLALLTEGGQPMLDVLARSAGGDAGLAQRHASMRQVVAWSWRQLDATLLPLLQALAVFTATADAEAVASVAGVDVDAARVRLEQLRDHSLISASRPSDGPARYAMLQPVREFVLEHTEAATLPALRERLRQWLLAFAKHQAARGLAGMGAIEAELAQVYAVILDAAADGPPALQQAVGLAVALRRHWEIDTRAGLPLAVIGALQQALTEVQEPGLRCECHTLLGFSCGLAGLSAQAVSHAEAAVRLAPDARRRAHALLRQAQVVLFSGGEQSGVDAQLDESIALAVQAGDLEAQALALRMQFLVAINRDDDTERGEALATQVQALWERLGHRRNAFSGLMDRASCWLRRGRVDEALTALAACEQAALRDGYATGHIMASWQVGRAALRLRRGEEALAAFRRCLQASWDLKRAAYVADALVQLPGGLAFSGQPEDAARLMGFAVPHWQTHFGSFYRELGRDVSRVRRWLRLRLGPVRMEALRVEGACLTLVQAMALAQGRGPGPEHGASAQLRTA